MRPELRWVGVDWLLAWQGGAQPGQSEPPGQQEHLPRLRRQAGRQPRQQPYNQ